MLTFSSPLILVLSLFYKSKILGSRFTILKSRTAAQPTGFPPFLSYGTEFKPHSQLSNSSRDAWHISADGSTVFDLTTVLI